MISSKNIRRAILSTVLFATLALGIRGVAGDTGTLLASFTVPQLASHQFYFPVGVAFDGTNIWYSNPSATDPHDIFLTSPTGTLLRTIGVVTYAGGLAWDGTNLWVANFDPSATTVDLFQVSVGSRPAILKTVDVTSIILGNGSCPSISGLDFDTTTNTIWVVPNPCFGVSNRTTAYHIDTSGNLLGKITFSFLIAGVAKVGNSLYFNERGISPNVIVQTDLNGNVILSFALPFANTEDLSFDSVTFQHSCALWVMHTFFSGRTTLNGSLNAFQIECPN